MGKIDVTSGTTAGLGSGIIAIRPSGMAPQPAAVTVTPNAGATDADYVISSESWQYAVSHIANGGETVATKPAAVTVPTRRKKVVIDFTDVPAGTTVRIYRKKAADPIFTEFTDSASLTSFTDDGSQTWTKTLEQPKEIGAVARDYAALKKGDNFSIEKRLLADGNWQLAYRINETENRAVGFITLTEVANQATWVNTSAGADIAIAAILAY